MIANVPPVIVFFCGQDTTGKKYENFRPLFPTWQGTQAGNIIKAPHGRTKGRTHKSQFKPHGSPIFCRCTGQDAGGTGGQGRKPTQAGRNRTKATHPPGAPTKRSPWCPLKFAPYFWKKVSLVKKSLEILWIGLRNPRENNFGHQEYLGNGVICAKMVHNKAPQEWCEA